MVTHRLSLRVFATFLVMCNGIESENFSTTASWISLVQTHLPRYSRKIRLLMRSEGFVYLLPISMPLVLYCSFRSTDLCTGLSLLIPTSCTFTCNVLRFSCLQVVVESPGPGTITFAISSPGGHTVGRMTSESISYR